MPTYTRRFAFNAGRSRSGLSSVRYSLDGGTTWSTAGVAATVAGSGRYAVTATLASGFQGEIDWDTGDGDKVSSTLTLSAGGSGYTSGTGYALGFTGGGGTGAAGTFDVAGGAVQNLVLTAAGSGYTAAPALSFPGAGAGSGAAATCALIVPRGAAEAINPDGGAELIATANTTLAGYNNLLALGTVNDVSPQAGTFVISLTTGTLPITNAYIGRDLCFTQGAGKVDKQTITGYSLLSSTTARVSFTDPFAQPPANGDAFTIL